MHWAEELITRAFDRWHHSLALWGDTLSIVTPVWLTLPTPVINSIAANVVALLVLT